MVREDPSALIVPTDYNNDHAAPMKAIVQRVTNASVTVEDEKIGSIHHGYVVLLGIHVNDTLAEGTKLIDKLLGLRIMDDEDGRMNRSILDVSGSLLLISQFTLYADVQKGRRPSFLQAMRPPESEQLYEQVVGYARQHLPVETGRFGADMQVSLTNDGPVTIILDTTDW